MNYYERHLGDYAKQTVHLSMLQHGAYTLLLDRYYSSEKGIQATKVYAVAKATSKPERAAVDSVLEEFFKLVDGLWIKNRCEEELDKARSRVETARQNGRNGGRPKKQEQKPGGLSGGEDSETQQKPSGLSPEKPGGLFLGSQNKTQTKALHSPSIQTPDSRPPESDPDISPANITVVAGAPAASGPRKGRNGHVVEKVSEGISTAKRRRIPPDTPTEHMRAWSATNTPDVNFDAEIATLRDHQFRDAHSDWDAVIRNWLRRAAKSSPKSAQGKSSYLTRFEARKRALENA